MKKIILFCNNFSIAFNKKNISDYSASAAFFLFLSLIPMMMLVFAILPYTGVSEEVMIGLVLRATPPTMETFVSGIISEIYERTAGIITVSIVITLWSAGKSMQSLIRGLNVINDIEENRGFFVLRAYACFYTLIMMAAITIMMVLLMFGRSLFYFIAMHIPKLEQLKSLILNARYPVSLIFLVLLFSAIYCLVPSLKQKFSKQLPGAFFSAVVWSIASFVFSLYLQNFNGFSTYGSMATVIIVMVYMYMMMYIMMIGAYLNYWLGRSVNNTCTEREDVDLYEEEREEW